MNRTTRTILAALATATTLAGAAAPALAQPDPYERGKVTAVKVERIHERAADFVPVPGAAAKPNRERTHGTHVVRYAGGIRKTQDRAGRMVGYHLSPYGRG